MRLLLLSQKILTEGTWGIKGNTITILTLIKKTIMSEKLENNQPAEEQAKQWETYSRGNKTVTLLTKTEGVQHERVSLTEAIDRLKGIIEDNEKKMDQAFANAPDWAARSEMKMNTFRVEAQGAENTRKEVRTMIKVPSTFSKQQRETLKEYAMQMGGSYQNMKVVTKLPDGSEKKSFPAQIEFGKGTAYSAEVCAKILLGVDREQIINEIMERNKKAQERQQARSQETGEKQEKPQVEEQKPQTKQQKKSQGPKI